MESSKDKHHAAAPRNKTIRISRTLCLVALGVAVLLSYTAGRLAQQRGVIVFSGVDTKLDDHGGGESAANKQATINEDLLASTILADRPEQPPVFRSSPIMNFRVKSWDTTSKEFEDPSTPSNTPPYLHNEKGDLQLSSRIYAELLVQPALLAHPNPKFVGIFMQRTSSIAPCPSTTATAIVDQVLQHSSIVEAITIFVYYPDGDQQDQLDATNSCPSDSESYCESTADTATLTTDQQNCAMPSWAASASDDATHRPRIEVVRYSSSWSSSSLVQGGGAYWTHSRQKFNVVILDNDSIIRDKVAASSEERSGDDNATDTTIGSGFWKDILDDENGILVTALRGRHDYNRLETIRHNLDRPGYYAKITDYRASIGSSSKLSSSSPLPVYYFAVAFKNWTTFAYWHMNEAEYTLRLRQRHILDDDQHDGRFLHVFDGPTMTTFSHPSRKSARIYCQVEYGDKCNEIELEQYALDPYVANVDQLQVKPSSIGGPYAGRGVFTLEDAPKGTYFDLFTSSHAVHVPWTTFQISDELITKNPIADNTSEPLAHYFDGYGFYNEVFVSEM